jgi:hypothetical protein
VAKLGRSRIAAVGLLLAALLVAPVVLAAGTGLGPAALPAAAGAGLLAAIDTVGWVLVPQILLAVAVLGLALEQLATRASGLPLAPPPRWLPPAVESALLLGLLGTISGMVTGFVGLSPDALEPGPLIQALGRALRSSFVGFAIALVGVWTQTPAAPVEAAA